MFHPSLTLLRFGAEIDRDENWGQVLEYINNDRRWKCNPKIPKKGYFFLEDEVGEGVGLTVMATAVHLGGQ